MTVTITLWHILVALVALAGGAGTIGALIAAGVSQRWVGPLIRAEIAAHEQSVATVDARAHAIERVIEDHVRRDDGTIHKRLHAQDDRLTKALQDAILELRQVVGDSAERLSRIEGLLEARIGDRLTDRPTPAPGLTRHTPPHGGPPHPPRRPGDR